MLMFRGPAATPSLRRSALQPHVPSAAAFVAVQASLDFPDQPTMNRTLLIARPFDFTESGSVYDDTRALAVGESQINVAPDATDDGELEAPAVEALELGWPEPGVLALGELAWSQPTTRIAVTRAVALR